MSEPTRRPEQPEINDPAPSETADVPIDEGEDIHEGTAITDEPLVQHNKERAI